MSRVDVSYPDEKPPLVRLATKFAPNETMTPSEARNLAAELIAAAAIAEGAKR